MTAGILLALLLQAETTLPDAGEEARAQALMREIRCVVCENEPVSQSTAEIAIDMRRTIRSQIDKGASDEDVRGFFRERYGNFVSFRPPAEGLGMLLWAFPFILLAIAGVVGARMFARRKRGLMPLADDRGGEVEAIGPEKPG